MGLDYELVWAFGGYKFRRIMKSMMKDPCMKQISRGLIDFGPVTAFCRAYSASTMNTILHIFMPKGWILQDPKHALSDVEYCNKRYHMYQFIVRTHEYSFNYSIEEELLKCGIKAKTCSSTRWMLTRRQAEIASLDWCNGPFDAETIEDLLHDDICTLPIDAYRTYMKELDDEYYARCFAMQLCELDGYAGQPIVSGNIVVWGQNPAQNV